MSLTSMRLNSEQKKRFTAELRKLFIILAVGLFYFLFIQITSIRIPCIFYELTSFLCPGCGITRMCVSIIRLDFASAFGYNKFVFVTLPVLVYIFASVEFNYISRGKKLPSKFAEILCYFEMIGLAVFFVLRNIF